MTKRPRYSQEFKDAIVPSIKKVVPLCHFQLNTVWPPLPLLNGFMAAKNK